MVAAQEGGGKNVPSYYFNISSMCHSHTPQVEQDMALLMNTSVSNPKAAFFKQWTTVYVPAILGYAEKSKRKSVVGLLASMNKTGKLHCQLVNACTTSSLNYCIQF